MTLGEAVAMFLDFVRVEKGLAANTLAAYEADLRAFAEHAGAGLEAGRLDADVVRGYLAQQSKRGLGASSAARHLSVIRGLVRFLVGERALAADVTKLVDAPKIPERLPRAPTVRDVKRLLRAPKTSTPTGLTHAAMLHLAFASGLRVSELVSLRFADVDLARQLVTVRHAKRGGDRAIPFDGPAAKLLRRYIRKVRPLHASSTDVLLFVSPHGGAYTREHVWRIVRTHAERAGLSALPSPHQLRHALATTLLAGGAHLVAVQRMLGHADLGSTVRYTRVDVATLRAAHRRAHPRG